MLRGPDHIEMRTGASIAGPSDRVGEIASAIADTWDLTRE